MTSALPFGCVNRLGLLALAACALAWPGAARAQDRAADKLIPLTVELGDVSLTKLPFIMAADNGIYERNGLKVSQFITPGAAAAVRGSGVIVPPENIKSVVGEINIGGGSPTMVRMTSVATAPHRVILATTDDVSRFHVISRADITRPEDLKGKRIGYGNLGALDHFSMVLFLRSDGLEPGPRRLDARRAATGRKASSRAWSTPSRAPTSRSPRPRSSGCATWSISAPTIS